MSTPQGNQGNAPPPPSEDRRKGDRRAGDRRGGEDRPSGITVNRRSRRGSFFDHPVWVGATVLVGIALGIGLMSLKGWDATGSVKKPIGLEMKIIPSDLPTPH